MVAVAVSNCAVVISLSVCFPSFYVDPVFSEFYEIWYGRCSLELPQLSVYAVL